jgi:hypothetical protein
MMLPRKQDKAFSDFYDASSNNDILGPKVTLMILVASSMAVGCGL